MKKTAIILSLLLLFQLCAGCASPRQPELPTQTQPSSEPQPTQPAAPGIAVYTDDSAYTSYVPPARPEGKYTRLRPGKLDEFLPSKDYGTVYPYAAAAIRNSNEYWIGNTYGLIDRSGRILTDGIYAEVAAMEKTDGSVDQAVSRDRDFEMGIERDYAPLWLVSQYDDVEEHTEGFEDFTYIWYQAKKLYGVVAMDGSFAIPVEYELIIGLEDSFVCYQTFDEFDSSVGAFHVYDFSGKLLFSSNEINAPAGSTVSEGDGLFLIQKNYADYSFVDRNGETVLGPYESAGLFREGLACVSKDGESCGYIDVSGQWVLKPRYRVSWPLEDAYFRDGTALLCDKNDNELVIDRTGNVLLQVGRDSGEIERTRYGYYKKTYPSSRGTEEIYDRNGRFLFTLKLKATGMGSYQCKTPDGQVVWAYGVLRSLEQPENELAVWGQYLFNGAAIIDGVFTRGYEFIDDDGYSHRFVPEDLSQMIELPKSKLYLLSDYYETGMFPSYLHNRDRMTGELIYRIAEPDGFQYYDSNGSYLGFCPAQAKGKVVGGMLCVITAEDCIYYNRDGSVLFNFPFNTMLND